MHKFRFMGRRETTRPGQIITLFTVCRAASVEGSGWVGSTVLTARRSGTGWTGGCWLLARLTRCRDAGPDDEDINFIWRSLGRRFNGLLRAALGSYTSCCCYRCCWKPKIFIKFGFYDTHKTKAFAKVLAIVCSECALLNTMQGNCIPTVHPLTTDSLD